MRATRRLLLLTLLLPLLLAQPAAADDASVKRAWDSEDPAYTDLGRSVARERDRWIDRGYTRDGRLLRLFTRGERLSRTLVARLEAEQPSSPTGTEARDWALRSMRTYVQHFIAERRFTRAMRPGGSARATRLDRRAQRLFRRSADEARRARNLFKQLGLA